MFGRHRVHGRWDSAVEKILPAMLTMLLVLPMPLMLFATSVVPPSVLASQVCVFREIHLEKLHALNSKPRLRSLMSSSKGVLEIHPKTIVCC